ncbi:MAG: hypothetical protein WD226_07440 [Planctomycetota bacterium]
MLATALLIALPAVPSVPSTLERVHVVGASVSDGFGTRREFGATLRLDHVLDVALPEKSVVGHAASEMMFLTPVASGDSQIEAALDAEATLLIGIDFLFWYAYGVLPSEEARLERFEEGLAALEQFEGTILIGDIPDVRYALPGGMLFEAQLPELATIARCNERLAQWAAERRDVHVVPLAKFLAEVPTADEITVRGERYLKPFESLLQRDLLHANVDGTIALVRLILDSLPGIEKLGDVTWSHAALRAETFRRWAPEKASGEQAVPVPNGGQHARRRAA